MVQGVEGSNPFSHPIFSQGFQSLEWVVPSNITGTDPLGHSWATLLLGFRSGLVPEIPSFAPCQGKFLPSSFWSKNGVTALTSVCAYRRVWFRSFGAFLTVTWRVTSAIGSSWAMNSWTAA